MSRYGTLIALLIWTAVTLYVDLRVGLGLTSQLATIGYVTTPALVLDSGVYRRDNWRSYRPRIRYEYQVHGQRFEGSSYRHNVWAMNDNTANRIAGAYSQGAPARVYYNPRNPEQSVLSPGIQGMDLMLLLLVTPLNVVMICGWTLLSAARRARSSQPPGLPVRQSGPATRVFVSRRSATAIAGTVLFSGCLAAFVPIWLLIGFAPSTQLMTGIWLLLIGVTVLALAYVAIGNWSDARCITIHRKEQRITMPGRYESQDLEGLMNVSVSASRQPTLWGESEKFLLYFEFRDQVQREPIALPFRDARRADDFLKWLKKILGLKNG